MLSAENQIVGTVTEIKRGANSALVVIAFGDNVIQAVVGEKALQKLDFEVGKKAAAVFKSSHVVFGTGSERYDGLSARNQFAGIVTEITYGKVDNSIEIKLPTGTRISGTVTKEAAQELGFDVGVPAIAIVKATDVELVVL